jgi:hypothetical protein
MAAGTDPKSLDRLRNTRETLMRLHKILLEYQRGLWERNSGRVKNSYELLNLVMHDRHFSWLHYLSELIVQIDEVLALTEEERTEEAVTGLLEQTRFLMVPLETGDEFQKNYFQALQESPDVVLAHSEVVRVLGKRISDVH